ncbi:hypothetical protein RJD24_08875 [Bacillaceae bacterium IKA-2]|nr:hypothetical protein RJD24_08875 [Bacillaceae bacterium IKA-2]
MDLLTGWIDLSDFEGVTSPDYRVFRLKVKTNYSKEYFKNVFQICFSNRIFYGLGQGVSILGRWRLQTEPFLNFSLPIPPKDEQEEIVAFINSKTLEINRLLSRKQSLLEQIIAFKKSLIYEVVTGKKEIN